MFDVDLAPLGGILDPLKSDLGVFWPKILLNLTSEPFWTKKIWLGWQGGSGKVKIWPRMGLAYVHFWLWSPLETPKWVKDPRNGLKSIRGSWGDHLRSISGVFDPFRASRRPVNCFFKKTPQNGPFCFFIWSYIPRQYHILWQFSDESMWKVVFLMTDS